jgi:hypothetical protein
MEDYLKDAKVWASSAVDLSADEKYEVSTNCAAISLALATIAQVEAMRQIVAELSLWRVRLSGGGENDYDYAADDRQFDIDRENRIFGR